jgi:hypothetical protein
MAKSTSDRTMADEVKDALEAERAAKSDEDEIKYFTKLVNEKRNFILACIKHIIKKQTDPEPQAVLIPIADLGWPTRLMSAKSEELTKFETFVAHHFQKNEGLEVSFKYPSFYEKNDNPTWLFVLFNGPYTRCTDVVGLTALNDSNHKRN